jgi:hypothetical protein
MKSLPLQFSTTALNINTFLKRGYTEKKIWMKGLLLQRNMMDIIWKN